jgi:hypothetical protein
MSDQIAAPSPGAALPETPGTAGAAGLSAAAAQAAAAAAAQFPAKAVDTVQLLVDTIHDKAVRPAVLAARAVVFGLLVAAMAILLLVLGSIAVVRLLDVYAFGHRVWLSDVVVGGLLTLAGLAAWTRRSARPSPVRPD